MAGMRGNGFTITKASLLTIVPQALTYSKQTKVESLSGGVIATNSSVLNNSQFELDELVQNQFNAKFPIPPVAIRPSLRADYLASATYEDDLTHKLADIIKTNEKLRTQKDKELVNGVSDKYGNDLENWLQYHMITYLKLILLSS